MSKRQRRKGPVSERAQHRSGETYLHSARSLQGGEAYPEAHPCPGAAQVATEFRRASTHLVPEAEACRLAARLEAGGVLLEVARLVARLAARLVAAASQGARSVL